MSAEPKFVVAFDETHNPRGKLSSNYKQLQKILESEGYICWEFTSYPITREALQPIDILVIACPDQSRYDRNEIKAIRDWVTQDGGGLLLLSHAGGDKGRRSNLSELSEEYGITFENDQVLDKDKNLQNLENYLLIDQFIVDHPVLQGLSKLCFRASSSLTAMNLMVKALILSGDRSNPPQVPLLVSTDIEEGRVVGCGSYEMFRDKVTGGISFGDNQKLILNILDYLKTDKKYELKKNAPTTVLATNTTSQGYSESFTFPAASNGNVSLPSFDPNSLPQFNSEIKISKKGDLAVVFGGFMQEFINFKNETINKMQEFEAKFLAFLRSIIDTEEEVYPTAAQQYPQETVSAVESEEHTFDPRAMLAGLSSSYSSNVPNPPPHPPGANPPSFAQPVGLNPPNVSESFEQQKLNYDSLGTQPIPSMTNLPELTPLPPKPGSFSTPQESQANSSQWGATISNDQINEDVWNQSTEQPPTWESIPIEEPPLDTYQTEAPPIKKIEINIEELKTELRTLTAKIDSVKRLKEFITKKFESGGMNEDSYKKQLDKLNNDLKAADFRIEEINALLKKYS